MRQLLKPGALGHGKAPVGTLADFLEVSGEHEGVVDEFLREELNYLVVNSWTAAEQGVNLLKSGVDGRATFSIHPEGPAGGSFSDAERRQRSIAAPASLPSRTPSGIKRFRPLARIHPAQAQERLHR